MGKEISAYQIDISKLNRQVKELSDKTANLRKEQEDLNKAFKDGALSEEEYNKKSKVLEGQLEQSRKEMNGLIQSLKEVKKEGQQSSSVLAQTFGQAVGAMQSALGGIISSIDNYRQKMKEAQETSLAKAQEKELEKVKKKYEDLFNTEDGVIKQLETTIKQQQAAGKNTVLLEEEKKNAIEEQLKQARKLKAQKEQELVVLKQQAEATKTIWQGGSADAKHKQALFNVKKAQQELEQINTRVKTIKALEENYLEELNLKAIASEKKLKDEKIATEKKLQEKRLADNKKLQADRLQVYKNTTAAIEDLRVQLIEDDTERQKAQIELNKNRALKAIDEVYHKQTDTTKKLLDEQKKLIVQVAEAQIRAINKTSAETLTDAQKKIQELHNFLSGMVFKFNMADPQLSTELKKARHEISEIEYENETLQNTLAKMKDEFVTSMNTITETYYAKVKQINDQLAETEDPQAREHLQQQLIETEKEFLNNRQTLQDDYLNNRLLKEQETLNAIEEKEKNTAVATLDAWSQALGGVGDIFNSLADLEDENSKKSMQLKLAGIYMNMASGLATGIANAAEAGWPGMLATIPSTVAMMIAEFAQVKKLKSQAGYAKGGLIKGEGSGTSDSINTNVSNGESIINAKATSLYAPLLDAINRSTGGAPIQTANNQNSFIAQLATALSAMPNPVVSVQSIENQKAIYNKSLNLKSI